MNGFRSRYQPILALGAGLSLALSGLAGLSGVPAAQAAGTPTSSFSGSAGTPVSSVSGGAPTVAPIHRLTTAATLYDQTSGTTGAATNSQIFEPANAQFNDFTADDFVVPAGSSYNLSEVDVLGFYYNGSGPASSVNVFLYRDNSGLPGAQIASYTNLTPTGGTTNPNFNIPIPATTLATGTYWVSVQANMNFSTGGEWGWDDRSPQVNNGAAFYNPGGGFNTACTASYGRRTTCVGDTSTPDQAFKLLGTVNPVIYDNNIAGAVANGYNSPFGSSTNIDCCTNSQIQAAYPTATDAAADNFSVPTGVTDQITGLDIPAVLVNYGNAPTQFQVTFYSNTAGKPGSVLNQQTVTYPNAPTATGSYTYNLVLNSAVSLTAGSYFLSVQAIGSGFRWYWDDTTQPAGDTIVAQWEQPGAFDASSANTPGANPNAANCPTFMPRTTCVGDATNPDQAFDLRGTQAGLATTQNGSFTGTEGVSPGTTGSNGYYLGTFTDVTTGSTCTATNYSASTNFGGPGVQDAADTIVASTHTMTPCSFDVYGHYRYQSAGNYTATTTVTGPNSTTATLTASGTIGEAALSATGAATQSCAAFTSCTFTAGSFTDANTLCISEAAVSPVNGSPHYAITITYGDGTSGPPTSVTQTGLCTFRVNGTHTFNSNPTTETVTFSVCDVDGGATDANPTTATCASTSTTSRTATTVTVGNLTGFTPCSVQNQCPMVYGSFSDQYSKPGTVITGGIRLYENAPCTATSCTVLGILNFRDTSSTGLIIPSCSPSSSGCRLNVTAFRCTSASSVTIAGTYTYLGVTNSFRVDVTTRSFTINAISRNGTPYYYSYTAPAGYPNIFAITCFNTV